MKKAKILLTVSLLSLGALVACGPKEEPRQEDTPVTPTDDKKDDDKPSGEDDKPSGDTPEKEDDKPSGPSYGPDDEDEDEGDVRPPVVVEADFGSALEKDYSNMTAAYEISSSEEWGYEFYAQDMVLVYDGSLADIYGNDMGSWSPFIFYSNEYNGDYYTYWRQANGYNHDGWIADGLYNSDLAIWHAYFYMPKVLENLTEDDVEYYSVTGQYYVKDESLDKILDGFESFFWTNDPHAIAFTLNDLGYISTIVGIDNPAREDSPYFKITLSDFGTTEFPTYLEYDVPEKPNENNTYTYKEMTGKEPDDRVYPESVELNITEEHKSSDVYDLILDIDESIDIECLFAPDTVNRTSFEWVSTNENVVSFDFKQNFTSGHRYASGIAEGDAEIYVISKDERNHTQVESPRLKVHVNKIQEIENEDAIYEFDYKSLEEFTVLDEEEKEVYGGERVTAQNLVGNALPYTITTWRGEMLDGRYTEALTGYDKLLALSPCTSNKMNEGFYNEITFDFDDQQVSSFQTYYSLHNSGQAINIDSLRAAKLMTSNDGENWEEIDIKDELVATFKNTNGDYELNKKILAKEFEPASIVKLHLEGNSVGKNLQFVFAGTSFEANEFCLNHVEGEITPVESVQISAPKTDVVAHEQVQFVAEVSPEDATNKNVKWHSSDESIIKINPATGVAEGLAEGSATIYATSVQGGVKSNEITVNVSLPSVPSDIRGNYNGDDIVYDGAVHIFELTIDTHSAFIVDTNYSTKEVAEFDFSYFGKVGRDYHFESEDGINLDVAPGEYPNQLDIKMYKGSKYYAGAKNAYDTLAKITYAKSVTIKDQNGENTLTSLNMIAGDSYLPWVDPNPLDVTDTTITATSSNEAVATVSGHRITAVAPGDAVITYTAVGGAKAELPVHVDEKVNITSLAILGANDGDTIKTNETINLTASYLPENANVKNLIWTTSNDEVATVDKGKVTGIAAGDAKITVTDTYTGVKAEINLHVSEEVSTCVFSDLIGEYDLADETYIDGLTAELTADNKIIFKLEGSTILTLTLKTDIDGTNYIFSGDDERDYEVQVSGQVWVCEKDDDIMWFFYYDYDAFLSQIVIR